MRSLRVLEENRWISLDITWAGTQLDDLERGYHVQVDKVEEIRCRLPKAEWVTIGRLV